VERVVEASLRPDRALVCRVPTDQSFVVEDPKLTAPQVAALFERGAPRDGRDLDDVSALTGPDPLWADRLLATLPRLPGREPLPGQVNPAGLVPREFVDRDAECAGDLSSDAERRLRLTALVPADLATIDADPGGEVGLAESKLAAPRG
jgi:hypothetical protein